MSDCVNILICSVYLNGGCVPYRCQDYRQMSLCSEINIEKHVTVKNESIESLIAERDYYKRLAEAAGEYIDYHNDVNNTYEFDPVKFDKLFENYQSIKQERER